MDALGARMKGYYEERARTYLTRRMPVAIRIDGKSFHTFTRGFQRPFDEVLGNTMIKTMEYLVKNIQGAVFGYCQSDEITIILIDYQNLETDAWFDYQVQKICSIAASMATMAFNKYFVEEVQKFRKTNFYNTKGDNQYEIYSKAIEKGAIFDARCFNIPKEEVCNLIYWRQVDAMRNSVQMIGQANFSHKELQGKTCEEIKEMLRTQKGIRWDDFPLRWKRGVAIKKFNIGIPIETKNTEISLTCMKEKWMIDQFIPIFKNEDRKYIEDIIFMEE